jgi:hypothetical protein
MTNATAPDHLTAPDLPTPAAADLPTTPAQRAAAQANGTLGILSLIAGIAGIVLAHTLVVPAAAIVLGFFARSKEPAPHGFATWGIVLGFVGLFGWILVGLLAAAFAIPLFAGHSLGWF